MGSVRTEYRLKRIAELDKIIIIAIAISRASGFQLERVNLSDFKNIKNDIKKIQERINTI